MCSAFLEQEEIAHNKQLQFKGLRRAIFNRFGGLTDSMLLLLQESHNKPWPRRTQLLIWWNLQISTFGERSRSLSKERSRKAGIKGDTQAKLRWMSGKSPAAGLGDGVVDRGAVEPKAWAKVWFRNWAAIPVCLMSRCTGLHPSSPALSHCVMSTTSYPSETSKGSRRHWFLPGCNFTKLTWRCHLSALGVSKMK